ncbi:GNAT family N-acetyltransferase [Cylindrospermum sp. FACHB-282]|uniref:GNAT family N-acetyltransferase n=1 Tax=Cylindrospermum sp. FACHB-282 TaxID=2692794 RepID=UPI00168600FC|nr:GNAT family N-acetyltransferase [Cylindrospermum sp. FACHB-282]MBD2385593.1 GNAT family N-acetyltransferase [Cylindrospermum sp. FACHB-282]
MIEELNLENIDSALELFKQYQQFYQVQNIDEQKNRQHLAKIMKNEDLGKLFLIREGDVYIGFATIYYSFSSTIAEQVAILNDLYVVENLRRKGFGRHLIEHCINYLKTREISIMKWVTHIDNLTAQKLYNYYCTGTEWLSYSYKVF